MTDTNTLVDSRQCTADVLERIREAASAADVWNVVLRPTTGYSILPRARATRLGLKRLQKDLAEPSVDGAAEFPDRDLFQSAVHELRARMRLFVAAVHAVSGSVARLPRIAPSAQNQELRVEAAVNGYLSAVNGAFSIITFRIFVHELQGHEPLLASELWRMEAFLKLATIELLLGEAGTLLRTFADASASRVLVLTESLRTIDLIDWSELIEPLIVFEATLREDPQGDYARMDFESRELYRRRLAFIAFYSNDSEARVAQIAIELASNAALNASAEPRLTNRRSHVGYYLIDSGFPQLASRVGYHPPLVWRVREFIRASADEFYTTSIGLLTILVVAATLFPLLPNHSLLRGLLAVLLLMLLPASQCAVDLVNDAVTAFFEAQPLPKLDFSETIPAECTTLVAVPSLLQKEEQVRALVSNLEVRFLGNRDPHLHFALLTDLPDSVAKPHEMDSHPLVELASQLIGELNARYNSPGDGAFMLLHRRRIFNRRQGVWMGWERKRGKLLDLNKLLVGEYDAFPIKAGRLEALQQVRYILTLDSDTQLPRDSAAQLIGAIAHPLNQAIVDPKSHIVTAGYGILQPRVGIAVRSTSGSRLAAIFSGHSGLDKYTRAVSDVYQDLFGEGSFTGKGIYEVETLHAVLNRRFPHNTLLSHDLIEGAYARAGLVSDVELIEDYPSHYSAYSRRKHRWMRGDWQIVQWMFSSVPDESGRWSPNPISDISRWKVFDNLRRSLMPSSLFILFVAGWLVLPGGPLYWTIVPLTLLLLPPVFQFGIGLIRTFSGARKGRASEVFSGFWRAAILELFSLIFLPHQTLLALDAVVRSLVRRFITGERLLEWETASEAEHQSIPRTPTDRYLAVSPLVAIGLGALILFFGPHNSAALFSVPILLLWALASVVALWLNQPPREDQQPAGSSDTDFLLAHALRIWRYFQEFGGDRHNYLIPDNVEEDGLYEAARTSPTNIGLLLDARLAACALGFLTVPEFASLTRKSFATMAQLEKFRGHLYNWYDTQTLRTLGDAPLVSTVDSGNLVAALYTLLAGTRELARKPLLSGRLFAGLSTHWQLIQSHNRPAVSLKYVSIPGTSAPISEWALWIPTAEASLLAAAASPDAHADDLRRIADTQHRIRAIQRLLYSYLPWLLPEYGPLVASLDLTASTDVGAFSIEAAAAFSEDLEDRLGRAENAESEEVSLRGLCQQLRAALPVARQNLRALAADLEAISQDAERFAADTEFGFLVNPQRKLLSIGYDSQGHRLDEACYDVLASEARVATFLAIARDDLRQRSWFSLSSQHAYTFRQFVLLSWSGTMFEYLMPSLWMRGYPDTLLSGTLTSCVRVQRSFSGSLGIPWGISESGSAQKDDAGHYRYQAYGVPQAALNPEATAGPVVSPYSTFLALTVDSREALRNLRRMESAGWVGLYGFYEAADYTGSLDHAILVREWMAHHQGMSLLAVTNLLCENVMQRWFHSNPLVHATEALLQEMPVRKSVLKSGLKEFALAR